VEGHLSDDCPLTVITVQVRRIDLPSHNVLVGACVSKDKLELQRLKRENADLKGQLARFNPSRGGGALSPTVRVTLSNFSTFKAKDQVWYSPPFYAQGYKLCAAIAANGFSTAKNTHVSMLIYLMRGASDRTLRWPFQGVITLQLIDQTGEDHITHVIDYTSGPCHKAGDRVSMWRSRSSIGLGKFEFVSHHELSPRYLTHDCLHFQVSKIELT
jgi:hypothetical protein